MGARKEVKKPQPKAATLIDPQDMTPEQLALALKNCKPLEAWIKTVRAYAFSQIEAGTEIPGWGLGYGIRQRIWREGDEKKLERTLLKAGLKHEDIFAPEHLLSPAQMEKKLKEHDLWPKKPRNGERPPSIMDEYVEKSMPAKKLVEIVKDASGRLIEAESEFGDS